MGAEELAAKIAALKASLVPVVPRPEPSYKLLYLCCSLYIKAGRKLTDENYAKGALSIFNSWFYILDRSDQDAGKYPGGPENWGPINPRVCACGKVFSDINEQNLLHWHCSSCKGSYQLQLLDQYVMQRISRECEINPFYLESIFAQVIYDRHISRENSSTEREDEADTSWCEHCDSHYCCHRN